MVGLRWWGGKVEYHVGWRFEMVGFKWWGGGGFEYKERNGNQM